MVNKNVFLPFPESFDTICMHHNQEPNQWKSKAVIPHIVPSTIFEIDDPRQPRSFMYGRVGNPTRAILETVLATINKGKYGLCFSSGISALMSILSLLNSGEHIICNTEIAHDTFEVFTSIGETYGISTTFAPLCDIKAVGDAIQDKTKLIWVENPSDATLRITDICALSKIAKESKILLGVDNTYLTPYLQRPLELGADIVMHSLTKYMNGHSDIIMGSLCTNRCDVNKQLSFIQVVGGMIPSPFDCYQVLRGLKTLGLRMEHYHNNSLVIANFLKKNPSVEKVMHPGLECHPDYNIFKSQASGHSGIISFYVKGEKEQAERFLHSLKLFTITDIAGGTESTVQIPYLMSHKHWTSAKRREVGITGNLVKISLGLENLSDLILDIEQALDGIRPKMERIC